MERRLVAVLFDDADSAGAVDAVLAYRNSDGGFGHGLEPDKRCPASLPIDVERELDILIEAGYSCVGVDALVLSACDWLGAVACDNGAVPLAFPEIENYPRAEHWTDWTYVPGLNPTAGLAGRLHRMGVTHQWLTRATHWTWARLESGFDADAHALVEVLEFLAYVPDRSRAEQLAAQVGDWLADLRWFRASPGDPGYGLTPLHLAPTALGGDCLTTPPSTATSTGWSGIRSPTAAGVSPGMLLGSPLLWSGAVSRHFELCAPSRPTVGSDLRARPHPLPLRSVASASA